jgi:hypothetical protein
VIAANAKPLRAVKTKPANQINCKSLWSSNQAQMPGTKNVTENAIKMRAIKDSTGAMKVNISQKRSR